MLLRTLLLCLPILGLGCHISVDRVPVGGDAAAPPDAASEQEIDSGVKPPDPVSSAVFSPGETCQEEEARACAGFDTASQLVCRSGIWTSFGSCLEGNRCDTRVGLGQGLCQPIVGECAQHAGNEAYCSGRNKIYCGPDRITAGTVPCADNEVCTATNGKLSCVLDPSNECELGLHDCDDDPNACVDMLGGFTCKCPAYYEGDGRGTDGCSDVLECATGNGGCSPLAACNEVRGGPNTCQCPSGYSGNGQGADGCIDDDECSQGVLAACGVGAKECVNTAGNYECLCGAAYAVTASRHACAERVWGAVTTTERKSAGLLAWTETGHAYAFGPALKDTGPLFVMGFDRLSGWSEPVETPYAMSQSGGALNRAGDAINTSGFSFTNEEIVSRYRPDHGWSFDSFPTQHVSTLSAVAINDAGQAVMAWFEPDGITTTTWRWQVWARQLDPVSGWSAGTQLSIGESDVYGDYAPPNVRINGRGDIIVSWQQAGSASVETWANRYVRGDGWQGPFSAIDGVQIGNTLIALNDSGGAVLTDVSFNRGAARRFVPDLGWQEPEVLPFLPEAVLIDDTGRIVIAAHGYVQAVDKFRLFASEFSASTGWGTSHAIGPVQTRGGAPLLGVDADGNVTVVWEITSATLPHEVWVARYRSGSWLPATSLASNAWYPQLSVAQNGTAMVVGSSGAGAASKLWYTIYE